MVTEAASLETEARRPVIEGMGNLYTLINVAATWYFHGQGALKGNDSVHSVIERAKQHEEGPQFTIEDREQMNRLAELEMEALRKRRNSVNSPV
jgi:hypothetical protein